MPMHRGADRIQRMETRLRYLEERLRALRLSRRVLMDLLALRERERAAQIQGLARENRALRRRNSYYARQLLQRYLDNSQSRQEIGFHPENNSS